MEVYGDNKCPAPPASDDVKSSSGIGQALLNGPLDSADLTQLLASSVMILKELGYQRQDIKDLQQTVKFLAEQVKTLVDALAEDQDPDMPLTTYMDGKPI